MGLPTPPKPDSKALVQSWTTLWKLKLNGDSADLRQAIDNHVALFERGDRDDARLRALRTLSGPERGDAKAMIQARIDRGLRTANRGTA